MINTAAALARVCTKAQALPMKLVQAIKKLATDTAIKTTKFNERASSIEEARIQQGILMHLTPQSTTQVYQQITTFTGDTFTSLPQWKANVLQLLEKSGIKKQTWASVLVKKIAYPATEMLRRCTSLLLDVDHLWAVLEQLYGDVNNIVANTI